jgi:hypothetical protein
MLQLRHSRSSLILVMFGLGTVWKFPWEEIFQMSRNLAATGFAGALLVAIGVIPSAADELFIPYQAVQLPDAGVLGAFDISFVDPASRTLAVAVSRAVDSRGPFGTVVIVNTNDNVVTKELIPDPPFAGACSFPGRNTVGGPNGVMMPQR